MGVSVVFGSSATGRPVSSSVATRGLIRGAIDPDWTKILKKIAESEEADN
jgi:hypothetical protein